MNEHQQRLHELEETAQAIAQTVGPIFDQAGECFALLGFSKGAGGWATWVSNAERSCMIQALEEMVETLKRNGDMPPIRDGEPEA